MWPPSERLTRRTACFAIICALFSDAALSQEEQDETVLLQVNVQLSERASQPQPQPIAQPQPALMPQLLTSQMCHDSLCGNKDWEPFAGDALFDVVIQKYDWLTGYCKLTAVPEQAPSATPTLQGACLIKGCLAEGNLVKGANDYALLNPWSPGEAEYCFREHCNNTQFDLRSTTQMHAISYCDQRFGPAWRSVTAGPDGKGWTGEQPGSGLWECAHGTYHCDWSYCKLHYCNRPELLMTYSKQQEAQEQEQKQEEAKDAMEQYAEVATQLAEENAPVSLLDAEAAPAQLLYAQMGMSPQQGRVQPSLLQAGQSASAQMATVQNAQAQLLAPQAAGLAADPELQMFSFGQASAIPAAQKLMMDDLEDRDMDDFEDFD